MREGNDRMKIYAVVMPHGEYEDYFEERDYFLNKEKAENNLLKYNKQIKIKKEEIKKCYKCAFRVIRQDTFSLISYVPDCFRIDKADTMNFFCSVKDNKFDEDHYRLAHLKTIEVIE